MKIMALLTKDLKSLKWPLGVYYLFLLGQNAFLWTAFNTDALNMMDPLVLYPLFCMALNAVATLFLALLTPLAVQEDPVDSDTAFWATRPISPMALLAEKALFVALALLVPPIVFEAINAALGGGSLTLVGAVALGALLSTLKCAAFFALAAALTRNMKSYLAVVGGVLLVWLGLLNAVKLYLAVKTHSIYFESISMSTTTKCTIILLAVGLLVFLYRSRNSRRTAVAAIIAFAALATAQMVFYHKGLIHAKDFDKAKFLMSPGMSEDLKQANCEIEKISPVAFGRCLGTKPALVHYVEAARHYIPNLTVLNLPAAPENLAGGFILYTLDGIKYGKAQWNKTQTKAGKITEAAMRFNTRHITSPFETFDIYSLLKCYGMESESSPPSPNVEYLLVNLKTGEALLPLRATNSFAMPPLPRQRFDIKNIPLDFVFKDAAGQALGIDQKWLDDAELASFDLEPVKCPAFPAGAGLKLTFTASSKLQSKKE